MTHTVFLPSASFFSPRMSLRRQPVWLVLLGCLLLAMGTPATAQTVNLNTVQVPVADRSAGARNEALREALTVMLVRISGQTAVSDLPGGAGLLERPASWVEQFSYSGRDGDLTLEARFDVRGISEQLARAGAPVWGRSRPQVLVWAAPDRGDIVSAQSDSDFARGLRERAAWRGLPLQWPAMDSEDHARISAADIRGRFDRQIQNASQRYQAPLVVSVVYYTSGRPGARWRLLQEGNTLRSGEVGGDGDAALGAALADAVSDYLAEVYAVRGGAEASALTVRIEGIERLETWHTVQQFVGQQAGVRAVRLAKLDGDAMNLQVDFSGDTAQLERLLQLHRHLGACREAPTLLPEPGAVSDVLRLCWQGAS
ncbi:DUF2066 domain-containing protein [Isoalcanivorax indicus]|uniref:DUF2066 domain-containing protein n=1 Tax=Isoalcanivorax indicus TaxID=2202653 RepID=UPI0013C4B892|nr:DUF2066 domain-containing protein [Isoalcanivorax indicus]